MKGGGISAVTGLAIILLLFAISLHLRRINRELVMPNCLTMMTYSVKCPALEKGTRSDCVELYALLAGDYLCLTAKADLEAQRRAKAMMKSRLHEIRGKDLACWCALDGKPCHADVLLVLANEPRRKGMLDRFVVRRLA